MLQFRNINNVYLNEYINNDKLVFKFVSYPTKYENWDKIETYVYKNGRFVTLETYRMARNLPRKKPLFKKLLEFFNKL